MEKHLLTTLLFSFMTSTLCFAQDTPITEVEGEPTTYTREGKAYYPKKYGDDNYIYEGNQGGPMTVVFGTDRQVYFQDPVYGYTHGTYVKGTLSEDGKTITVSLPQVLYNNDGIDIVLAVGKFDEDQKVFKQDKSITEVIYDVTKNEETQTLSLRLTDKMTPLGNFWSDYGDFAGRGEWSTVLTKYIEKTETIEVTEEEKEQLVTVDHPLGGAFWQGETYKFLNDTKISVATTKEESDTILVQGMVPMLPEVWAKGLKKDGVVTFPVQLLTVIDDQKYFLAGLSGDGLNLSPFALVYDEVHNSYTAESKLIVNNSDINYNGSTVLGEYTGIYVGERPALVQLPEGYDPANIMEMPYEATYNNGQGKTKTAGIVNVLFHGEDIYIQGLIKNTPEGWLKGQFNQTQEDVFFPLGQYMGYDAFGNIYAVGDQLDQKDLPSVNVDDPAAIRLAYDSENKSFKLMNNMYASHQAYEINRDDIIYAGMTINEGDMWVAAKQGYENGTAVTAINIATSTAQFSQADNSTNAPKYYNSGQAVRMYAGNTITITSTNKTIGKVAFIFDTSDMKKPVKFEGKEGTFTLTDSIGIWTGDATEVTFFVPNESDNQARIKRIIVFGFDYSTTTVTLPEDDFIVMSYQLKATIVGDNILVNDEEIDNTINVGKHGNDFYFQGLSKDIPEAWVKGTLSENKVTIPNWLLGTYLAYGIYEYEQIFGGAVFNYDPETETFTADSYMTKVPSQDDAYDTEYTQISITKIDTGISSMSSDNENVQYFDLQGHMVQPSAKGLVIQKTLKNDGTTITKKVIRR